MARPSAQYERMTKDDLAALVVEAAQRLKEEHSLCEEVNQELRDMGLGHLVTEKRVVMIEVDVTEDTSDREAYEMAMQVEWSSDKVEIREGELDDF